MNDQQKISILFQQFCNALLEKDVETLRTILHPDCIVIPLTGLKQTADTFISSVEKGIDLYTGCRFKSIDLRVIGNSAWAIAKTIMTAALYGGESREWRFSFKITLRSAGSTWQFTELRFTVFE